VWAWAALVLALVGTAGSVYLTVGLGLKACPLCYYQRAFMMAAFAVLAVGLLADRGQAGLYCTLALAPVAAGLGVAGYHAYLVHTGRMVCPDGVLGLGTAPDQSLASFVLVAAAALLGVVTAPQRGGRLALGVALSVVVGAALTWGSLASSLGHSYPPPADATDICQSVRKTP
jgi:disulfide bond formation protein DsbB